MLACTDELPTEISGGNNDGKGIGEMVLFTAGSTSSNLSTRADDDGDDSGDGDDENPNKGDNYSETPGETRFMLKDYRFVCRMYYQQAQSATRQFDISENSKSVAWLQVGDDFGNSNYRKKNFDIPASNDTDPYGNDNNAPTFYWQNRLEHAFLAWTDLNQSPRMTSTNGNLIMEGSTVYQEHTNDKARQSVLSRYMVSGSEIYSAQDQIDEDFVSNIIASYSELQSNPALQSDINKVSGTQHYDPNKINSYNKPLNNVRYSYAMGDRHDEKYDPEGPEDADHLLSFWRGPILMWIWGEGQELPYTLQEGDVVDEAHPLENGDCWVMNGTDKVALRKKVYVDAETQGAISEEYEVPDPTDENPDHTKTEYRYYIYKYLAIFPVTGKFHYDFSQPPMYTVAIHKFYEVKETDVIQEYNANSYDLTRGSKTSIKQQPDICLARTIKAPTGTTQTQNRVNLYFQHQFSQVQVNLKNASDNSVALEAGDITDVELLGVTEEGYVFTDLQEDGTVHPAAYKDVVIADYSEAELADNEYGTSLSLFDMKDDTKGEEGNWGYPTGYLKSYNGITFGQLKAIRITWREKNSNPVIYHKATMKVTDQRLSNLKSGFKYIWNVELRRGTLATLRVQIVDWIVPLNELQYETSGTIDEDDEQP